MNKSKYIGSIAALLGICVCGAFLSFTDKENNDTEHVLSYSIPEVPITATFAGEKISLSRYDMYERYERELTATCYMHSTTLLTLKRANRYMPVIEPILKREGVPVDFVYLAAIESHFNPRARSSAGAAGIWQFMPKTAREYGLEVNDCIDERYNIEKSTVAACKYLKKAYQKYGSWVNAAASYNAGLAKIASELEKQGEKSAFDLLLVEETSRYVFRILAMKQVLSSPADYGFVLRANQLYQPIKTKTVEVDTAIANLTDWAKRQGTTYFQLKEFNPWLRTRELQNKSGRLYKITIPIESDLYYTSERKYKTHRKEWVVK